MTENGSNRAYEFWRDSAEKFNYFMAGLSTAVLGYLAPMLQPAKLGWNSTTLELVAMLTLVGAAFAAFKRIESTVHLQRVGVEKLKNLESVERLSTALQGGIPVADSDTGEVMNVEKIGALLENRQTILEIARTVEKDIGKKAERWYAVRYYLLMLGFLLLLSARVWKAYQ